MQIRNDYHTGQGQTYSRSHTNPQAHYTAEGSNREEAEKRPGEVSYHTAAEKQKEEGKAAVEYVASFAVEEMSANRESKKKGTIKNFWDSLGEEEGSSNSFDLKQTISGSIHAVAAALREVWEKKVVKPFLTGKERIKAMPVRAMERLGKDRGNFGELLKGGMLFDGGKSKGKKEQEKEELQMKQPEDQHLLDSYNKSGNYCRLHENLTYQKPKER